MTDPTRDPTANDVAYDNMRPNSDPTHRTNDQTIDPTPDLTLTPTPEQVDMDALTIPAAAERLGLTSDAIRMRLKRGSLAGRKVNGRWVVLIPRSNVDPTATERAENAQGAMTERLTQRETQRSTEHLNATRELIDSLRSENTYLRSALDAEMEARRRADHLVAGLMERLPELAATTEDAPVSERQAPQRDVAPAQAPDTFIDRLRRLIGR